MLLFCDSSLALLCPFCGWALSLTRLWLFVGFRFAFVHLSFGSWSILMWLFFGSSLALAWLLVGYGLAISLAVVLTFCGFVVSYWLAIVCLAIDFGFGFCFALFVALGQLVCHCVAHVCCYWLLWLRLDQVLLLVLCIGSCDVFLVSSYSRSCLTVVSLVACFCVAPVWHLFGVVLLPACLSACPLPTCLVVDLNACGGRAQLMWACLKGQAFCICIFKLHMGHDGAIRS